MSGMIIGTLLVAAGAAKTLIYRASRGKTYCDAESIPATQVGVVLGCAPRLKDRRPNPFFENRISAAAKLYFAGKVSMLVVSGADEVDDMKAALVQQGVPAERIHRDPAGYRTLDSIVRAKEFLGRDEVTIVSQEFHNRRAIFVAQHIGLNAIGFNATDVRVSASPRTRLREHFARSVTVLEVMVLHRRPKPSDERIAL